eukprot:35140-Eustigmatos_ZCMA.PRE.1
MCVYVSACDDDADAAADNSRLIRRRCGRARGCICTWAVCVCGRGVRCRWMVEGRVTPLPLCVVAWDAVVWSPILSRVVSKPSSPPAP